MKELEDRVAELEMSIREHVVAGRQETRQQNSRLRRVEAILISTAGATILLLVTIILRHTG